MLPTRRPSLFLTTSAQESSQSNDRVSRRRSRAPARIGRAQLYVRARCSAVSVASEPTLTDQALASTSGLHDSDRVFILPVVICVGWVLGRHPFTVVVSLPSGTARIATDPDASVGKTDKAFLCDRVRGVS